MGATTALIISAAATAYGASQQSQALNAQADYSEKMAEINKRFADRQADDAIERGDKDAKMITQRADRTRGSQRAGLAAQGLALDSGSALDIQQETARMGAEDAAMAKQNARMEAWGIRTNSANAVQEARMRSEGMRNEARSTLITGGLRTVGSLASARGEYLKK